MTHTTRVGAILLSIAAIFLVRVAARAGEVKDALKAKTVWKGEIRQGSEVFPATIYVNERNKDRIRGEVHFTSDGELNTLTLSGVWQVPSAGQYDTFSVKLAE